jgi:hypothetical protein
MRMNLAGCHGTPGSDQGKYRLEWADNRGKKTAPTEAGAGQTHLLTRNILGVVEDIVRYLVDL